MPKESITRRFEFDYGHRVLNHNGKCKYLHGHRGVALVSLAAHQFNELSMIHDFGDIKKKIGEWIDNNWDHNLLLHKDDPLLELRKDIHDTCTEDENFCKLISLVLNRAPYIMQNGNPTAEMMARELFFHAYEIMRKDGIEVTRVVLYETPNSFATYEE